MKHTHDNILVSGDDEVGVAMAHEYAVEEYFLNPTEILESDSEGTYQFLIPTSGCEPGSLQHKDFIVRLLQWVQWAETDAIDGGYGFDWIYLIWGGDPDMMIVENTSLDTEIPDHTLDAFIV